MPVRQPAALIAGTAPDGIACPSRDRSAGTGAECNADTLRVIGRRGECTWQRTERVDDPLRATLAAVAPGTALRDGLERILRGRTGALIVLGYDKVVDAAVAPAASSSTSSSPRPGCASWPRWTARSCVDRDCTRILRAAVHLVPDPAIPTDESGTRHRTADRVAKQTGLPGDLGQPVDAASSRSTSTTSATCWRTPTPILSRANQALATLERYKLRLDEVSGTLSALEIEDLVTVRDVVRGRAAAGDGPPDRRRDRRRTSSSSAPTAGCSPCSSTSWSPASSRTASWSSATTCRPPTGRRSRTVADVLADLDALDALELLDLGLGRPRARLLAAARASTPPVSPRGYRLLARVPRLPGTVVDRLVDHFGSLQKLLAASIDDLQAVDGVGEARARSVREGLSRLAESSILERYV